MAVAIDTTPLTPEQRLQLPLLMAMAFKLPCAADGAAAALSKDDFVAALQADTVRYACDTGCIKGGSSQLLTFFVQVELDGGSGLEVALKWIRRALYLTQLTPELLGIAVKRELSQIPAAVRNGSGVMSALSWLTNYTDADNDLNGAPPSPSHPTGSPPNRGPPYRHPARLRASFGRSASTRVCTHGCVHGSHPSLAQRGTHVRVRTRRARSRPPPAALPRRSRGAA